jgi:two-component system chemotaxis sensor kinase CheA
MVPIGQVFDKLARVVRKLSRDLDKEIRLVISGAETVLDKLIVEELSDPLMHMIRNCIDHGIEPAAERVRRIGKQPAGRIELRAFQKGNRVVIEVEDDGNGMDWRRIRDAACVGETSSAPRRRPDDGPLRGHQPDLRPRLLDPRAGDGEVSGRGVGMDVVKTNIAKLSGMIDVHHRGRQGHAVLDHAARSPWRSSRRSSSRAPATPSASRSTRCSSRSWSRPARSAPSRATR